MSPRHGALYERRRFLAGDLDGMAISDAETLRDMILRWEGFRSLLRTAERSRLEGPALEAADALGRAHDLMTVLCLAIQDRGDELRDAEPCRSCGSTTNKTAITGPDGRLCVPCDDKETIE